MPMAFFRIHNLEFILPQGKNMGEEKGQGLEGWGGWFRLIDTPVEKSIHSGKILLHPYRNHTTDNQLTSIELTRVN